MNLKLFVANYGKIYVGTICVLLNVFLLRNGFDFIAFIGLLFGVTCVIFSPQGRYSMSGYLKTISEELSELSKIIEPKE